MMLTAILKEDIPLAMDPDSPLNRAHQKERQAERLLNAGRYEEAIKGYQMAAELTKEAMSSTVDTSAILSLKLQYESLLKQPLIIKRRQEVNLMKAEFIEAQSPPWNTKTRADQILDVASDNPYPLSANLATPSSNGSVATPSSNGYSQRGEDEDQRLSLEGVYHSLEETRPLLECLRQHSISDGDRSKYFAGQLLDAYEEPKSSSASNSTAATVTGPVIGRKMPKNDEVVIEELQVQNKELCQHIVKLLRNMEHCEQENRQLKNKMQLLEQELETIKSQSNSTTTSDTSLMEELGTAFSLTVVTPGSVTTPPIEIPPLPPLELPDFDVN